MNIYTFQAYIIDEADGFYVATISMSNEWTHIVMVYVGTGSGIIVYHDGIEVGRDTHKETYATISSGSGRLFIDMSITFVDEVKMYNRQLSVQEICKMYQTHYIQEISLDRLASPHPESQP